LTLTKSLDTCRALLLCYSVIFVHGMYWLVSPVTAWPSFMLFTMPLLFMVTGYAFAQYVGSRPEHPFMHVGGYLRFLKLRFFRLMLPYMTYAILCAVYVIYAKENLTVDHFATVALSWVNPFSYGTGYSHGQLNWHLWFIPVYLLVTALLPMFATQWRSRQTLYMVSLAALIVLCALLLGPSLKHGVKLLREVVFYAAYAWAGYAMARTVHPLRTRTLLGVAFACVGALVLLALYHGSVDVLNMQRSKFPPNHFFLLFSVASVSVILAIRNYSALARRGLERIGEVKGLFPFLAAGYSIYLWQGMAYTISTDATRGQATAVTWGFAVAIVLALGVIMGPIERIKLRSTRRPVAVPLSDATLIK
jgi:peptidoglycan/LPS O-acetylase OafA/YrhL